MHYIYAGNALVALYIADNGVGSMYYAQVDYQGSLISLTDAVGNFAQGDNGVVQRFAYDPWGNRRLHSDWTKADKRRGFLTDRGYTMHEHLETVGIINMNGRIYDPMVSRFLSPDPFVQDPNAPLNYNRYTYCLNNPMLFTDPSGYKTVFGRLFRWCGDRWDGFWDMMDRSAKYLDEHGVPSFGVGVNVNTSGQLNGNGSYRGQQVFNTEGYNSYDPAINAQAAINSAQNIYYSNLSYFNSYDYNINARISNAIAKSAEENVSFECGLLLSWVGLVGEILESASDATQKYIVNDASVLLRDMQSAEILKKAGRFGPYTGWTGEAISITYAGRNFLENPSPGNLYRFSTSVGIAGVNISPAGSLGSFALGILDNSGGFNWYYNLMDYTFDRTGFYFLPIPLCPFPIYFPNK